MNLPRRDYATLDAIAVTGSLVIVGGSIFALVMFRIPESNLPILSAIVSGIMSGIIGGYAGFRWGASVSGKHTVDDSPTRTVTDPKEPKET